MNQVQILKIPGLSGLNGLFAGFTGRAGGVSESPYDSLNFSFYRKDPAPSVMENHRRLAAALGLNTQSMVRAHQIHQAVCRKVDRTIAGIGTTLPPELEGVDAMITDEPGLVLLTTHADCVPVYLYDPVRPAVGMVHAGWGGALAGVVEESIEQMQRCFGSRPESMYAAFGPHIGVCCFETGADVYEQFRRKPLWNSGFEHETQLPGKRRLDLSGYLSAVMMAKGILSQRIYRSDHCTRCESDVLFSHRGSGGDSGCGAAFIGLEAKG